MKMFGPTPDLAYNTTLLAYWENGFTDEEINSICCMGERLPVEQARIGTNMGDVDRNVRETLTSWIDPEGWISDRLEYISQQLNGKYFGLDLFGFAEKFQYSIYKYDKNSKGHYTWHMDMGQNNFCPRKLSLVLQLSDPSEYEGGDLEFFHSNSSEKAIKKKGLLYAFPSYIMHRVTPVTKGIRRTLVVWITGPRFK